MKPIEIVAYKCRKCGKLHYPFHDRCMNCKGREFDPVHPQGNARLLTFTQLFNLPWGFDQRYMLIGVAEFENGVRALGQIQASSAADLQLGMALKPKWDVVRVIQGEKIYGLKYEPLG